MLRNLFWRTDPRDPPFRLLSVKFVRSSERLCVVRFTCEHREVPAGVHLSTRDFRIEGGPRESGVAGSSII